MRPRALIAKKSMKGIHEHDERQPGINKTQHDEGAENGNAGIEHVLGAVVREFGNFEEIVDDTGHNAARLVLVEEGKGHGLDMAE